MNVKEYRDAFYEAMDNMWKGKTMKQQKDNLYNYLQNRVIALTTYIKSYEDMIKEYPETESINRARIIATELQLEEINKVISYCEKRGRY